MGTRRAVSPNRADSAAVASESVPPSARSFVRNRWVARSRSPSPNHAPSAPSRRSSSVVRNVSSARPHPRSRSASPASQYVTESMSGETCRPCRTMSSPVLTTTVTSSAGTTATNPRRNLPAPTPPASATTLILISSTEATERWCARESGSQLPQCDRGRTFGRMTDPVRGLRRALARARAGKSLSLDETEALLSARGPALDELCEIAAGLRDLGHGKTITYSRKVFIPLTMLCRDHCHYCTFAKPPAKRDHPFLTPDDVVAIAAAGRASGCKEALFTLGDRPEDRYAVASRWLAERGYHSTLDYLRAVSIKVIEETGLLPHLNPGVLS